MAASELNLGSSSGYDSMHFSPALPQVSFNCQRSAANKPISSNKRGTQLVDDAPLQIDAGRQVLLHPVQALLEVGVVAGEMLFGPGNIHARADQQPAELVMQLTREACLLALGDALQMRRQLDEFAVALLGLALELQLLIAQFRRLQGSAPHIHVHQARGDAHQQHVEYRSGDGDPTRQDQGLGPVRLGGVVFLGFPVPQLFQDVVDGLTGIGAEAGFDQCDCGGGALRFLYRDQHRQVGEALADQHMQGAHIGEIGFGALVGHPHSLQPGFHLGDDPVVVLEEFLIAGQQEAALGGDRSGDRRLQLIDGEFANRGLLQPPARLLQPLLSGARQEKQCGQETDDEKGRYGHVPTAQTIQRLAQDVHAFHDSL